MPHNEQRLQRYAGWLFAIYAIALFAFIDNWGMVESSEARYAEISREMVASGDLMHPTLLNIYHFHKPPLTYWVTAFACYLFGINAFAVRFFLVVSYLLQAWLIYRIVLLILKERSLALASALIYCSTPLVLVSVRALTTDAYLNTFVLLCIFFFVQWRATQKAGWLYFVAVAGGLGFLTKGPLILIVPVLFFIGFSSELPRASVTVHHFFSFILFFVVASSWYIFLVIENDALLGYFFVRQTYDRVVHADVFSRNEPFWYYLAYTPLTTMPWSLVWFAGFAKCPWLDIPRPVRKMAVYLVFLPVLFFSIVSSKLILYVLPVSAGISVVSAFFLDKIQTTGNGRVVLLFMIVLCVCCFGIPLFDETLKTTFGLSLLAVVTLAVLVALWRNRNLAENERTLLAGFVFSIFLLLYSGVFLKSNELKVGSTRPLAEWLSTHGLHDRNILVYNRLLPSLAFHLNRDIISLYDGRRALKREVDFQNSEQWKGGWYNLQYASDTTRLMPLLQQPSVLIVQGKIGPSSTWLQRFFNYRHEEGDWVIYY